MIQLDIFYYFDEKIISIYNSIFLMLVKIKRRNIFMIDKFYFFNVMKERSVNKYICHFK